VDEQEYQLLRRRYVNTPSLWGDEKLVMDLVNYVLYAILEED